jgi:hypothetical protein
MAAGNAGERNVYLRLGEAGVKLIRPIVIVRIQDSAVIKSAVGAGGTDEDAITGKVDSERCAPGINVFTLVVEVFLIAGEDDEVLGILAFEGLGDFAVAADRISAYAFFVLLEGAEKIVHIIVELAGFSIDSVGVDGLVKPARSGQKSYKTHDYKNALHIQGRKSKPNAIIRRGLAGGGGGGALADDDFGGEAFVLGAFAAQKPGHGVHGGDAETKLRLTDGGQWNAEMFAGQNIAEADDRELLRDFDSLIEKRIGATDGDEIVHGLDRGGVGRLVDELQGGLGAVFDGVAGLKQQAVVGFDAGFTQSAAIAVQSFLGPGCGGRAAKESDALVAEFKKMPGGGVAGLGIVGADIDEGTAKRSLGAEDDDGQTANLETLVKRSLRAEAVHWRDEKAVHATGKKALDARRFTFFIPERMGENEFVTQVMGAFLDREQDAGKNRIGDRRDDDTEKARGAAAQAASGAIGDISQLLGEETNTGLGGGGNIRFVAHHLGDGHD